VGWDCFYLFQEHWTTPVHSQHSPRSPDKAASRQSFLRQHAEPAATHTSTTTTTTTNANANVNDKHIAAAPPVPTHQSQQQVRHPSFIWSRSISKHQVSTYQTEGGRARIRLPVHASHAHLVLRSLTLWGCG